MLQNAPQRIHKAEDINGKESEYHRAIPEQIAYWEGVSGSLGTTPEGDQDPEETRMRVTAPKVG